MPKNPDPNVPEEDDLDPDEPGISEAEKNRRQQAQDRREQQAT